MNTFLFGDQTLTSSFDFKELPRLTGAVTFSAIQFDLLPPHPATAYGWLHEWKESDDNISMSLALHESGFLLRFPELCDFIFDTGQRSIKAIPHAALDEYTIEHLLVDQVLPRFLANEGRMLLHACAANIDGKTVLFSGKSGWGKSTLAALLHESGYTLYSDDCVLLMRDGAAWHALATYPSLRLHADSIEQIFTGDSSLSPVSEYSDKKRIALTIEQHKKIPPLHALYFLSDPETAADTIQITPMRPANTCIELIQRSFRLDLNNHRQSRELMTSAAALTQSIPAYRLSYRHDYQNNHQLLALLVKHIQQ